MEAACVCETINRLTVHPATNCRECKKLRKRFRAQSNAIGCIAQASGFALDQGVKVLAFPANNFGAQEPGTNKEIKKFCETKFDVTFDLFAKISVKGDDKCDLYKRLTDTSKNEDFGGEIRWNFQKFLVDRTGRVVARFEPRENPMGDKIVQFVERLLKEQPRHPSSGSKGKD